MSKANAGAIETALRLRMPDQSIIEESAFGVRKAEVAASLAHPAGPYGGVTLRGGGQPGITLSDDLLPLARALAAGVARLRGGQSTLIASFSEPSEWAMERDDTRILTRATNPGEPPEPEPDNDSAETSAKELDASYYALREQKREDDAASLIAALENLANRLLTLLEGGNLHDERALHKLAGGRDILSGRKTLPILP